MARRTVEELLAKDEIEEALLRYGRGIDRCDRELMQSAYHDDAMHDHGGMFKGPARDYVEMMTGPSPEGRISVHYVTNLLVDFDGNQAHTECRWFSVNGTRFDDKIRLSWGRYIDRFEDRGDGWRIAARVVVFDNTGLVPLNEAATPELFAPYAPTTNDKNDISYVRPLVAPYVASAVG